MNVHVRAKAIHGNEAQIATEIPRILSTQNDQVQSEMIAHVDNLVGDAPVERVVSHIRSLPSALESRLPVTMRSVHDP